MLASNFTGFVAVILGWIIALLLWNAGMVSPAALFRGNGILRLIGGAVFAFVSLVLLYRILPYSEQTHYSIFAIGTFLIALVVVFLLGPQLRK